MKKMEVNKLVGLSLLGTERYLQHRTTALEYALCSNGGEPVMASSAT